jgi:galactose mutarotase-like enzyme
VPITLSNPTLSAQISALGAELVVLRDEAGRDLLWNGDPAFWTGRSPILFPIVGRVRDDRIRVGGAEYPIKPHGFARTSPFEVIEATETFCRLRLGSDAATRAQYPFDFRLDVTYRLDEATLEVSASVLNEGPQEMPASFGFHPAFRWPLPYGGAREAHEIRFEASEPDPIRRPADGLIAPTARPSPVEGRRLQLRDDLFDEGALVFDRLRSRSVQYGTPEGRSITIAFPCMPHLGIWTKPGAGFICIEPWQGYADPEGFEGELAEKPGIVLLEPGTARSFHMVIAVSPPKLTHQTASTRDRRIKQTEP